MKSKSELRAKIIDNPGGGDCGFYSFAINLLDIIQQQAKKKDYSTLDKWLALDKTLEKQREQILACDLNHLSKKFLQPLQQSLRTILCSGMKQELGSLTQYIQDTSKLTEQEAFHYYRGLRSKLSKNDMFNEFAFLYFFEKDLYGDLDKRHNLLANIEINGKKGLTSIIDAIAIYKNKEATTQRYVTTKQNALEEDGREAKSLTNLFFRLLLNVTENEKIVVGAKARAKSYLMTCLDRVAYGSETHGLFGSPWWATYGNLNDLSTIFGVQLHCYEKKLVTDETTQKNIYKAIPRQEFKDDPNKPVINLLNLDNKHWVTLGETNSYDSTSIPIGHFKEKLIYTVKPPINKANEEDKELELLINKVRLATSDYISYRTQQLFDFSCGLGFGKWQATAFFQQLEERTTLKKAREYLIRYLADDSNGDTSPYSYRTMIVTRLQEVEDYSSEKVSRCYDQCLDRLASSYDVELPEKEPSILRQVYNYIIES